MNISVRFEEWIKEGSMEEWDNTPSVMVLGKEV